LFRVKTTLFEGERTMPQGKVVFAGLNQSGLIVLIVLAVMQLWCLIWIPFVIDSMKGDPEATE
jgi:hypothetical protein